MRKTEAVQTPGRARVNHRLIPLGLAAALFLGSTCSLFNKPPSAPVISGPSAGIVGVPVEFTATATDPDGDSITYQFAWGDGDTSDWGDFLASGETATMCHPYGNTGCYPVVVRVTDFSLAASVWSPPHLIDVACREPSYPDSLVGQIAVDPGARAGAVTPDGEWLYIVHQDQDLVTPIKVRDRAVLPAIHVARGAWDIDVAPDGGQVYVSCVTGRVVACIRVPDNLVTQEVPLSASPAALAVTPDGQRLYVALSTAKLAVVRTSDNTVVDSVSLGGAPVDMAFALSGDMLYVTTSNDQVVVVATASGSVVDSICVGQYPGSLAPSPDGQYLYVHNRSDSGLAVIRAADNSVVARVKMKKTQVDAVAVLPDGDVVLATDYYGLRYIDRTANVVFDSLHYPGGYGGVAVHPAGDTVYVPSNRAVYVVGH